ncbi:tRNA pseudouridine(38-40) synthase TruA [Rubidibacter lacunae]
MQRVVLVVQYLGGDFCGWQRQATGRTVQATIEDAIATALDLARLPVPERVVLHGAGRTDAGVHAAAQIAHFDTDSPIPAQKWAPVLNRVLPDDISIRASAAVPATWHAQFSALWRRYRYTLYTDGCPNLFVQPFCWHYYHAPLQIEPMQAALVPLLGRHHLAAFHRAGSGRPHSWVQVQSAECRRRGSFVLFEIQASGFLYGMVRLLVGLLVEVGRGSRSPEEFTRIWTEQRRDLVKYSAPARGLCLLRVGYPEFPIPPSVWYDAQPQFCFASLSADSVTTEPVANHR